MAGIAVTHPTGMMSAEAGPDGFRVVYVPPGCESVFFGPDGMCFFDMGRAGGGAACYLCGLPLHDHPAFQGATDSNGNPYLTLGCMARLYKL